MCRLLLCPDVPSAVEGEVVTMWYMASSMFSSAIAMAPRAMRRAHCSDANTFSCCCPRCCARLDSSRTLRCNPSATSTTACSLSANYNSLLQLPLTGCRCPGCQSEGAHCMLTEETDTKATGTHSRRSLTAKSSILAVQGKSSGTAVTVHLSGGPIRCHWQLRCSSLYKCLLCAP